MKHSKAAVHWKARALPEVRFEDQQLTSFAGLVVFQPLFERLALKTRLRGCFEHLKVNPIFGHASIVMLLVVQGRLTLTLSANPDAQTELLHYLKAAA